MGALLFATFMGNRSQPLTSHAFWGSLGLWALQLIVGVVAIGWVTFLAISIPHCGQNCEWELLSASIYGFMIFVALTLVASMAVMIRLRRSGKVWIAPVAGIALILVACPIASAIAYKAMLFF
ncbi:hypothetical protein [Microbacterium sp. LB12]|uniref:hypothetical protein n=1 Tax=Microbacterium sp. LB12 TaxID=3081270 RepID=UPI00301761B9